MKPCTALYKAAFYITLIKLSHQNLLSPNMIVICIFVIILSLKYCTLTGHYLKP